jgi:tripartite-type tricarboxylate transporter receptor subunit TctC
MPITLRRTLPAKGSYAMGPGEREPQPSRAGSNTYIGMVAFAEVAGVQLVHVPSRSSGALTPLLRSDDIAAEGRPPDETCAPVR